MQNRPFLTSPQSSPPAGGEENKILLLLVGEGPRVRGDRG